VSEIFKFDIGPDQSYTILSGGDAQETLKVGGGKTSFGAMAKDSYGEINEYFGIPFLEQFYCSSS